jgi:thioredoxin reductase (NADPH)
MAPSASAPPSSIPYDAELATAGAHDAELAIVGAGPVGLYAAYYAGFRGLATVVIETLPLIGGQIATFYPNTAIYDVPGFPSITGGELVARLHEQASAFPVAFRLGKEVLGIAREGDLLRIDTRPVDSGSAGEHGDARALRVRAVLLAAGIGAFSPQRIPDPAIGAYEGRGLAYFPPPVGDVCGQHVLVLGGSERAIDVAITLAGAAASVTLVHRRDRLPVSDEIRQRLDGSPVRFVPFLELTALHGAAALESATLVDRRDGSEVRLDAHHVVPCYGFHADAASLTRFGALTEDGAILVDSRMASDRPGIWAAGDGATYAGKVRVLAADFGEACTAINNIAAAIVPGAHLFPGYSSHRKGEARRPR